ncbi:MAG: NADPH-dependent glutamate synthase [Candidatus Omnitrophota bacterium]|nr:NADPH-dependent glutamate synthase [Candidatus Omnitrophota bacterium]
MKKEPVQPKEQIVSKRIQSFDEVVSCYSEDEAIGEASRCLQCAVASCASGCPVGIDIKKFIAEVCARDYAAAYRTIRQKNNFPSMCGRVCPAEYQCRRTCVFTKKGLSFAASSAINIHFLERFIGDWGLLHQASTVSAPAARAPRVAVVGSGPAGLCCAGELARAGIKVVIFESLHKLGGVLQYGIPAFRLPREILDVEIKNLEAMGVEFVTNFVVGRACALGDLFAQGFSAVFLGLGAGVPSFLGVPGETLCNVYSANEFLTRINLMRAEQFPQFHTPVNIGKKVVVIGGGNTAIDSARVALRLQKIRGFSPDTTLLYRRTETEMPARRLEIEHAKQEGVIFSFLVKPLLLRGAPDGFLKEITLLRCERGEPDQSGRRAPVDVPGSEYTLPCDVAVIAIGLRANRLLTAATAMLTVDAYGDIIVNPDTMETSIENVFAGGDIVGGEGTVIEAMGMAKRAAAAIIKRFAAKGD